MVSARLDVPSDQSVGARYEYLIRLADSIRAQHATEELFRVLVDELSAVIPFDGIAQFDESSQMTNFHICDSLQRFVPRSPDVPVEETIAWWVSVNQQAAVIADVRRETPFPYSVEQLKENGLQSACGLPLSTAHRRLGSLVLASKRLNAYSEEEVRFLSLVAGQIALAIDDAINFQASLLAQETSRRAQERLEL